MVKVVHLFVEAMGRIVQLHQHNFGLKRKRKSMWLWENNNTSQSKHCEEQSKVILEMQELESK